MGYPRFDMTTFLGTQTRLDSDTRLDHGEKFRTKIERVKVGPQQHKQRITKCEKRWCSFGLFLFDHETLNTIHSINYTKESG